MNDLVFANPFSYLLLKVVIETMANDISVADAHGDYLLIATSMSG